MSKLAGKICLITGGAQGLGKAFSEALLTNGARVCFADVNHEKGEATEKEFVQRYGKGNAVFVKCDVTSQEDLENAFAFTKKTLGGPIEILCNNAGTSNEREWDKMMQVNLGAVIRGTMLGIENMSLENGGKGGTILNTASMAGLMTVYSAPVYCASKHGVVAFTRSWAKNPACEKMGLRFHALCPAFAYTDMIKAEEEGSLDNAFAKKLIGIYGIMRPETVAGALMKLLEKEDTSGEVLVVTEKQGTSWVEEPSVKL